MNENGGFIDGRDFWLVRITGRKHGSS
jgi:hypothetical protein